MNITKNSQTLSRIDFENNEGVKMMLEVDTLNNSITLELREDDATIPGFSLDQVKIRNGCIVIDCTK